MTMDTQPRFPGEIARSKAYKLLAECYHQPTNKASLYAKELTNQLCLVCPQATNAASSMIASGGAEDLAVNYARLFVGPFALTAPPYGSVHMEGERKCMGESTLDAAKCYAEFGLGAAEGYHDALDHIAVELEFMHFLCSQELSALSKEEPEDAHYLKSRQRYFLERHLAVWITAFTSSVEEHAQSSYYRNLAQATRLFVLYDLNRLVEGTAIAA
jgi:TorA maturation chaperone TorD